MATQLRATFFFKVEDFGWSETHWMLGNLTHSDALLRAANLARSRIQLCGQGVMLTFVRVSSDDVKLDASTYRIDVHNANAEGDVPTAVPYAALVVNYQSGPNGQYRRNQYLSGFPSNANNGTPSFPLLTERMKAAFAGYKLQLGIGADNKLSTVWGYRAQVRDQQAFSRLPVAGLTIANGIMTVNVPGSNYAPGQRVRFSRIVTNPPAPVNRTWIVQTNAGGGFFTVLTSIGIGALWLKNGTVQAERKDIFPYSDAEVVKVSSRPRGTGYRAPVGRRRSKARQGS